MSEKRSSKKHAYMKELKTIEKEILNNALETAYLALATAMYCLELENHINGTFETEQHRYILTFTKEKL